VVMCGPLQMFLLWPAGQRHGWPFYSLAKQKK
jgi:hypothetical protein